MRFLLILCLALSACHYKPLKGDNDVYLSAEIIFPLSNVKNSQINSELVHQVVFESANQERFDYLVQLEINAERNTMAFVATSLLGVPLISFTVNDKQVVEVSRIAKQLPPAERLMADLQMMLWPVSTLTESNGIQVKQRCENQCFREIIIGNKTVAKISYAGNDLFGDIYFQNLIHQYQMTIKVL